MAVDMVVIYGIIFIGIGMADRIDVIIGCRQTGLLHQETVEVQPAIDHGNGDPQQLQKGWRVVCNGNRGIAWGNKGTSSSQLIGAYINHTRLRPNGVNRNRQYLHRWVNINGVACFQVDLCFEEACRFQFILNASDFTPIKISQRCISGTVGGQQIFILLQGGHQFIFQGLEAGSK